MPSFFTSFDGRVGRGEFWYGIAVLLAVLVATGNLVRLAGLPTSEPIGGTTLVLVRAALLFPLFALVTRRCNDLALPDASLRQFIGLVTASTAFHLIVALRLGPNMGLSLVEPFAVMLTRLFDLAAAIWMIVWLTLPSGKKPLSEPTAKQA